MDNNLSSRQFFHGTSSRLKPGDMLHPNKLGPNEGGKTGSRDFVWSTTSLKDAHWYAHNRAQNQRHGSSEEHVYEVEHTGLMNAADNPVMPGKKERFAHVSLAPMRVKGEVSPEEIAHRKREEDW